MQERAKVIVGAGHPGVQINETEKKKLNVNDLRTTVFLLFFLNPPADG